VNATKVIASFSSIGPSFDKRIKPEVVAQGVVSVLSDEKEILFQQMEHPFPVPYWQVWSLCLWQALPK
jgi:hypothetical protein